MNEMTLETSSEIYHKLAGSGLPPAAIRRVSEVWVELAEAGVRDPAVYTKAATAAVIGSPVTSKVALSPVSASWWADRFSGIGAFLAGTSVGAAKYVPALMGLGTIVPAFYFGRTLANLGGPSDSDIKEIQDEELIAELTENAEALRTKSHASQSPEAQLFLEELVKDYKKKSK